MKTKAKKVPAEVMIEAILEHSEDNISIALLNRIRSGESTREQEYRNTGAFLRHVLDGNFEKAVRFADTSNILSFVALLAEGDYDLSLHKLLHARMHLIGMDRPKFTNN